ncbi:MAG: winged helix-turn-helix transcriptional regulator [Chloroflexi bacterium]|nr:winged helix-turn-helix transcriptional regulator [Chloroflexota bacterium]
MTTNEFREEITHLHANICSGLADPVRILILYTLAKSPSNVGDLAKSMNLPQPTTSRHLKQLRERGLVIAKRDGLYVNYRLADKRIIEALDLLRKILSERLTYRASLVED